VLEVVLGDIANNIPSVKKKYYGIIKYHGIEVIAVFLNKSSKYLW